jgi:TonB-dependent starch-binding outer membrane protein SusC
MKSNSVVLKIFSSIAIILFVVSLSNAQENTLKRSVSGIITSEMGETLAGVNIIVEGTNIGSISDINGSYMISVHQGNDTLVFSYIGYEITRVAIQGRSKIDVTLSSEVVKLSEIVVVAYGTVKKSDLTGSVAAINTKDYSQQPITQIDQVLQGRATGVQISSTNGVPGGDVKIRVRGANSILGNNNPLIIVDGISGVELGNVNVNDIESIQVLKDASSTAMYGSRGANGVVIITTKSGKEETPAINFNSFFGISYLPKKLSYLSPADFATIKNEANKELGYLPAFTDQQISDLKKNSGTDWQDELFRMGSNQNYQLSTQGGSKTVSYFISGEYINQNGILINSSNKRYNLRAKIESQIKKNLRIGANISANRGIGHNTDNIGSFQSSIGRLPTWPSIEPVWDSTHSYYNNNPRYGPSSGNPVGLQQTINSDWITNTLSCNGFVTYSITPELEIKAIGNVDLKGITNNYFDNDPLLSGPGGLASAWVLNQHSVGTQGNIIATYKKEIGRNNFQVSGIYEETSFKQEGANAYGIDLTDAGYLYHNLLLAGTQKVTSDYYDEYLRSFAGRINYTFANRYLITATMRADGSSKFIGKNKWGYFPSAALGWRLSEEPFLKELNIFSNLKLRASWGITGNQGIPSYGTLARMTSPDQSINTSYPINGPYSTPITGYAIGSPGNVALKWETTDQKDFGFEMALFDGKLSFEGDYYLKKTTDLLLPYTMPIFANSALVYKNSGSIQNKGFEILTNVILFSDKDFQWRTGFNFSVNRNKIIDLGTQSDPFASSASYGGGVGKLTILQVGQPLGTFYGYKYLGVWQTSEAAEAAKFGLIPGDAKFEDKNNDHVYNASDEQILSNTQPDFIFGINNSFTLFKNLEINLFFQGVSGGKIFNDQLEKSLTQSQSRDFNGVDIKNHWTPQNEKTDIPALNNVVGIYNSSQWLEDGSYIRLKNISAGYSLPKQILNKLKLSGLQIYISAQNMLTLTRYKGYDPEASSARTSSGGASSQTDVDQNIDSGAYPNPKTYTFGFKLSF